MKKSVKKTKKIAIAVKDSLHAQFRGSLPDDVKDFPRWHAIRIGILVYILVMTMFLYFLITTYIATVNQSFISLQSDAGACSEVPKPISGTFLASNKGVWEGSPNFRYVDAIYSVTFSNLAVSLDVFSDLIKNQFDLQPIVEFTRTHDYIDNLVAWMHFVDKREVNGIEQSFKMLSSPSDVYNRLYYVSVVMSANYEPCFAQSVQFNSFDASVHSTFPLNDGCQYMLNNLVGPNFGDPALDVKLSMNSASVAAAVNLGILTVAHLEITSAPFLKTVNGVNITVTGYFDPLFPHANQIFCVESKNFTFSPACTVEVAGIVMLPVLASITPGCIGCGNKNVSGVNSSCADKLEFATALIYSPLLYTEGGAGVIIELAHLLTVTQLKEIVIGDVLVNNNGSVFFDMCPTCIVLYVVTADEFQDISPYFYQLLDGYCQDSITIPKYNDLSLTAPVALVESYYDCTPFLFDAVWNAIGIAFGNTGTFMPFVMLLLAPLIYIMIRKDLEELKRVKRRKQRREDQCAEFFRELLTPDSDEEEECEKEVYENVRFELEEDGIESIAFIGRLERKLALLKKRRERGEFPSQKRRSFSTNDENSLKRAKYSRGTSSNTQSAQEAKDEYQQFSNSLNTSFEDNENSLLDSPLGYGDMPPAVCGADAMFIKIV